MNLARVGRALGAAAIHLVCGSVIALATALGLALMCLGGAR